MPDILEREECFFGDDTPAYVIGYDTVRCGENNVAIPIPAHAYGPPDPSFPPCPDCGSRVAADHRNLLWGVWQGRCVCTSCHSRFVDMRHGRQKPGRFMPGHPSPAADRLAGGIAAAVRAVVGAPGALVRRACGCQCGNGSCRRGGR